MKLQYFSSFYSEAISFPMTQNNFNRTENIKSSSSLFYLCFFFFLQKTNKAKHHEHDDNRARWSEYENYEH